jgi:hypothetical protein
MVRIPTISLPGAQASLSDDVAQSNSAQSLRPTFSGWGPRIA